ncbi:MAG: nucleotidyltransferase domain-containing protein [Endomicrobium sp.]|jgi:predicted nucleotidyltransferase|nr:nucleotidyltransferase domain-containing protein [Endomicrobium sp.]
MKEKVNELAKELRTSLQTSLEDFEGLYVFGSQAKGNAQKDSDVDVVVLVKKDSEDSKKRSVIWNIVSQLDYKYYDDGLVLDLHPMTRQELERNYFFHDEVVNKGVFYAAA